MRKAKPKDTNSNINLLTCCPVCGGKLTLDTLYQYSIEQTITRSGRASSRSKKRDNGSLECSAIYCENNDFFTDYMLSVEKPRKTPYRIFQQLGRFFIETINEYE